MSLTFDDGPDELWTGRVLEALDRAQAPATFFMVGENVRAAPAAAYAVIDAGHGVELHCDRHVRHSELSELEIERDTRAGVATLAELGVFPSYWRTPWGVRTAASERVAERNGLTLVGWTTDTHDWRGDTAPAMLARCHGQLGKGGIVLMHDAVGPGARRRGCDQTVELVGELVAAVRRSGLHVGALPAARAAAETATALAG
ncbi:MAG: polysaccharide deacetylase [Solirubrobacterales bacterium]|nr:polysaccharide deacetylase [Solirubrobacterales bacterium]